MPANIQIWHFFIPLTTFSDFLKNNIRVSCSHQIRFPFYFICESCLVKRNLKFRKLSWNLANFLGYFLQTPWVFTCIISECLIFIGNFLLVQSLKKQKKNRLLAQRSVVFVRTSVSTYVRTSLDEQFIWITDRTPHR